jgi:ferric enterobactin receptor
MRLVALMLCVGTMTNPVWAQSQMLVAQDVRVEGTVRAADGTPLPGALVAVVGTTLTAVTDEAGRYVLTFRHVPTQLILSAALPGYRTGDVVITAGSFVTADFVLTPAFSESVTVIGEVPMLSAADDLGELTLTPAAIAALPSLGARDLFRAFQLLPGVSGSNETSSGLFVRGGTPDQNAIWFDGFRVYHVDHLFGYFSAFNMDAIESVTLNKGGFEARQGGAVSGVMNITGKGAHVARRSASVGGSLLGLQGSFETPVLGDKASFLVAGRRSFQSPLYNKILNLFGSGSQPGALGGGGGAPAGWDTVPSSKFYDANAKFVARPTRADELSVAFYGGGDDVDNSRSLGLPPGVTQVRLRGIGGIDLDGNLSSLDIIDVRDTTNTGAGLSWSRGWHPGVQSHVTLGYSRFSDGRERSIAASGQAPNAEANALTDLTFRAALSANPGAGHNLEAGVEVTRNETSYGFRTGPPGAGFDRTLSEEVLAQEGVGTISAVYVQDRWRLAPKLLVVPGIRISRFDRSGHTYADPRLSVSWFVNEALTLKGATGRYHQFASRVTREDVLQGNRQFWAVADDVLVPVTEARHVVIGGTVRRGSLLFDVEIFDKNTTGLTEFAPRFAEPSQEVDYWSFFYTGDATSRGVDVLVQQKVGRHTGWIGYTNSRVTYRFPGLQAEAFPADQDRRHELKGVSVVDVGDWTLSGTWVLASGRPYTQAVGTELFTLPSGGTIGRFVVDQKNGARLPPYHRLDLALNRRIDFLGDTRDGLLSVTVFNLYNRRNVWYKEFQPVGGQLIEENIRLMGLTLNASVTFRF